MEFASLGSGSKGNGTLVRSGKACLLVDCGFTLKETRQRLERLGVRPEDIAAILVTHEHSDHFSGVGPLARRFDLPVYMTAGTHKARDPGKLDRLHLISSHSAFTIGEFSVRPVPVPHDAREPVQFVIGANNRSLGLLTDLGSLTPHIIEAYRSCDGLVLESNHCVDMLWNGPYPASLKTRVAGNWGHLSNQQAANFLDQIDHSALRSLVIAHLSEQNNHIDLVDPLMPEALKRDGRLTYACQHQGFSWIDLH